MPYHTDKNTSNLMNKIKNGSIENVLSKPKKKKNMKIFEKKPKNSHLMPDGKTVMSGSSHNKKSKVLGKLMKKKKK